ncbi:hypothetical protein [Lactobacillus sp. CBA3605]|uniref:hypothetical protein n=1 Tax=Lactobacillus sp. CBA3605 TaxID=2099788 RepID=UPI00131A37F1|nr:hypothetical protein [Lactobacillus sp. CBA3605]
MTNFSNINKYQDLNQGELQRVTGGKKYGNDLTMGVSIVRKVKKLIKKTFR